MIFKDFFQKKRNLFGYIIFLMYLCSQKDIIMELTLERKAHVFRFSASLLERLKELAKNDRRSLNNYVEGLLLDAVYHEPNEETLAAIKEAQAGKYEGELDVSSGAAMLKSMGL